MEEAFEVSTYGMMSVLGGRGVQETFATVYAHGFDDALRLAVEDPAMAKLVLAELNADVEEVIDPESLDALRKPPLALLRRMREMTSS